MFKNNTKNMTEAIGGAAESEGGAIKAYPSASLHLYDTAFSSNTAM
jgi:hypothetical protein